MSGFEVLGLACSIFQTISFAHETAKVCIDLYNGQKTPDSDLEEMASSMMKAADKVKESSRDNKSLDKDIANIASACKNNGLDREITQVANKCTTIATQLESEIKKITSLNTKSNIFVTIKAQSKSLWKRRKLEKLDKDMRCCRDQMYTLLITQIWITIKDTNLTRHPGFSDCIQDVRNLILNLENGHTKIEDILKQQTISTQTHITNELKKTNQNVNDHSKGLLESHERDVARTVQHGQLINSLEFPDMNARRNKVMDPEDATFERIFQSYGNTINNTKSDETKEIDEVWKSFVDWLPTDDSLFWIQGKPGAGKSTLMKYIINHGETQKLLDEWNPQTQIVSHYFWKIGSTMESSIEGLYCCLIHQLIDDNELLISQILNDFPSANKKKYFNDWPHRELEYILNSILKSTTNRRPICIFIDGLDEYCGNGGQRDIVRRIKDFTQFEQVKLCVSSRPEERLREGLSMAANLKLHELTRPDMESKIQATLGVFEKNGQISSKTLHYVSRMLIEKAEGVFLWLQLTMQNIEECIQNKDSDDVLISLLEGLPRDIEKLYADMWERQNQHHHVYRESAAKFFQFVIRIKDLEAMPVSLTALRTEQIRLLQIGCLIDAQIQQRLLDVTDDVGSDEIVGLCIRAEKEIRTRCVGLLEIRPSSDYCNSKLDHIFQEVSFVHRTAHDFLVDTEAGRRILSYGKLSMTETATHIVKGAFCKKRLGSIFETVIYNYPLWTLERLFDILSDDKDWMSGAHEWMTTAESFHEAGILEDEYQFPRLHHFLSKIIMRPGLYDFAMPWFKKANASAATEALTVWWGSWHNEKRARSTSAGIQQLMSCGADSTAIKQSVRWHGETFPIYADRKPLLWIFFRRFYFLWSDLRDPMSEQHFAEAAVAIIGHPPVLENWGLVAPVCVAENHVGLRLSMRDLIYGGLSGGGTAAPVFEANTSFLLNYVLDCLLTRQIPEMTTQLHKIRNQVTNPTIYIRFLVFNFGADSTRGSSCSWFRVIDQKPLESIIPLVFDPTISPERANDDRFQQWRKVAVSLTNDHSVLEPVELEDVLRAPAEEGRLGPCRLQDAGFAWSEELKRVTEIEKEDPEGKLPVTAGNTESSG